MNTYAWPAREKIKHLLTAIAGTCVAVYAADLGFGHVLSDKMIHVVGIVGIVTGICGSSPIGRLFFKDEDAPERKDPPA